MRIAAVVEQIQAVVIRAVIIAVISGNIGKSVAVEVGKQYVVSNLSQDTLE